MTFVVAASPIRASPRRDAIWTTSWSLANAAEDLLTRYGKMPRENLARAIAKRFGYRGLTLGVATRMEEGIAQMVARTADPTATIATATQMMPAAVTTDSSITGS